MNIVTIFQLITCNQLASFVLQKSKMHWLFSALLVILNPFCWGKYFQYHDSGKRGFLESTSSILLQQTTCKTATLWGIDESTRDKEKAKPSSSFY